MNERDRILREIRRNTALIVGCDADDVAVLLESSASHATGSTTVRAVARAQEKEFHCRGDDEEEALAGLLDLVVDGANAEGTARRLVMTPELQGAFRLLQLTRRDLIAEIRRELETNPVRSDD